jgi:putative redox protein
LSAAKLRAIPDAELAPRQEASVVSLTATARTVPGSLRQEVVVDGRHRLVTDEPERLGGDGAGPAPHELLPAALAACISTTLVMYARTKDWDLGLVTVDVDYDNRSTPRRFDVAIQLTGELTDEQVTRLEKVAAACPLRRSLETGFEFEERIERDNDGNCGEGRRPCPGNSHVDASSSTEQREERPSLRRPGYGRPRRPPLPRSSRSTSSRYRSRAPASSSRARRR